MIIYYMTLSHNRVPKISLGYLTSGETAILQFTKKGVEKHE